MTAPLHASIPATVVYKVTGNIWLTLLAAVLGMLPDVINNKYYHLLPKVYRLYNKLHRPWLWLRGWKLWSVMAAYVVAWPAGLHLAMDYDFHTDDDGMKNVPMMVIIEVFCWALLIAWWFGT